MNHARIAWALGATLCASAVVPSAPVHAQPADEVEAPAIEDIALMLGSPEAEEVQQAIEAAAVLGDPAVVELLQQRIREGLPPDLLGVALDALGLLASPESSAIFGELTRHRSASIRVRAVQGLVALGPEHALAARPALERALADSDPDVRAAAAQGLGELGLRAALPLLFQAFEVGIPNSGVALGRLAGTEHLDRLLGYLGRLPLDRVRPLVLELMAQKKLPEKAKLRVVTQLQEMGTAQARIALERVAEMDPEAVSARVRRAAAAAAARIAR